MPTRIDRNTFNPKYFSKYFTKQLVLACGVVAISTFNYAFEYSIPMPVSTLMG
jgi:hypothetical protein